jgi:hypothetical protein
MKTAKKQNAESLEEIAKKPLNIGIYVRKFAKNEKNTISVAKQRKRCEIAVKSRNWNVAKVYQGTNSIASDHDAYNQMMSDLREKIIDGITIFNINRIYRKNQDFLEILQMLENFRQDGHIFFSVFESLDNTTASGFFLLKNQIVYDLWYDRDLRDECTTSQGFDENKYIARQNEDIENFQRLAEESGNPNHRVLANNMRMNLLMRKVPLISTKPVDFLFP